MSYRSGYSETEQLTGVEKKCVSNPGQDLVKKEEFAQADEVRRTVGHHGRGGRLEDVGTPGEVLVERMQNAILTAN